MSLAEIHHAQQFDAELVFSHLEEFLADIAGEYLALMVCITQQVASCENGPVWNQLGQFLGRGD